MAETCSPWYASGTVLLSSEEGFFVGTGRAAVPFRLVRRRAASHETVAVSARPTTMVAAHLAQHLQSAMDGGVNGVATRNTTEYAVAPSSTP